MRERWGILCCIILPFCIPPPPNLLPTNTQVVQLYCQYECEALTWDAHQVECASTSPRFYCPTLAAARKPRRNALDIQPGIREIEEGESGGEEEGDGAVLDTQDSLPQSNSAFSQLVARYNEKASDQGTSRIFVMHLAGEGGGVVHKPTICRRQSDGNDTSLQDGKLLLFCYPITVCRALLPLFWHTL